MRDSVINLRTNNFVKVNREPGCYKWWFREECVGTLLNQLPNIDSDRLIHDSKGFVALYIGIATELRDRARWHILPNPHHARRGVFNTAVSTLRVSLSALLELDVTQSEQIINDFMDNNCEWEWVPAPHRIIAESWELQELAINYYPLNIDDNLVVDLQAIDRLKELRKLHKK